MNIPSSFWSVDIETLNLNTARPYITQVGVTLFHKGEFHTASQYVNPAMYRGTMPNIDPETLTWWKEQDGYDAMMQGVYEASTGRPLNALWTCVEDVIVEAIGEDDGSHLCEKCHWFFNPPGFDEQMLRNSEPADSNRALPWRWWQVKCFRTLNDILGDARTEAASQMISINKHDAGYDAEVQARALRLHFERLQS